MNILFFGNNNFKINNLLIDKHVLKKLAKVTEMIVIIY